MTETEWLSCSDPKPMLEFLRGKASDRKLRLFACACCRRIWHLLTEDRCRQHVEMVERYADGLVSIFDFPDLDALYSQVRPTYDCKAPFYAAVLAFSEYQEAALEAAQAAGYEASENIPEEDDAIVSVVHSAGRHAEERIQCQLLHDIIGSLPFRLITTDPAWLTPTIVQLAQTIYDERAFDQLPILADALEESGCTNADILNHCRQPGEHVRGCWALDAVLGKE